MQDLTTSDIQETTDIIRSHGLSQPELRVFAL